MLTVDGIALTSPRQKRRRWRRRYAQQISSNSKLPARCIGLLVPMRKSYARHEGHLSQHIPQMLDYVQNVPLCSMGVVDLLFYFR